MFLVAWGMPRREETYHHGNLKAALVKAAFKVVAKTGLDGFTLREIARQAGVSHNAPYRHFASKEDLIAALATASLRQLTEAVRHGVAAETGAEARLVAAARAYLGFALDHPDRFNLTFHAAFAREEFPDYVAAYTESLALLSELIQAYSGAGVDAELASELVWSSIHGIAELGVAKRLRFGDRVALEALAAASIRTLLAGLRRAPR